MASDLLCVVFGFVWGIVVGRKLMADQALRWLEEEKVE